MEASARIAAVFVGGPTVLRDARGPWRSSIARERQAGPVQVSMTGVHGDSNAQPYHGGPDAALCVHLQDHYRFWTERHGIALAAGAVGENLTLDRIRENEVCVGDMVHLGSVRAQVSGPRVPCANLARRIGRPDWVRLTVQENRTGFYLRVLQPGMLQEGDGWELDARPNPHAALTEVNRCMYLDFDPAFARAMQNMPGLGDWWRQQAADKLKAGDDHWTASISAKG